MNEEENQEKEPLTEEEMKELQEYLGDFPKMEEKTGIFNFFNKILKTKDTTKVSFLNDEELNAVRIYQSTALYANKMGLNLIDEYIRKEAEIILASANSRKGFLIEAAITHKKEAKLRTGEGGKKSGWFKKKD